MADNLPAPAATAVKAVTGALTRQVLTTIGVLLVSKGIMDQGQADAALSPVTDFVVGGALTAASYGWSSFRAYISHTRFSKLWNELIGPTDEAGA